MNRPATTRQSWKALGIGAAVTVMGCAAFGFGLLDRLDRFGLDLNFRHFGAIEADSRIVLIDIDDQALATMPEWPWPRRRFAQLVSTLHELQAEVIVLDLVFADPTTPRSADARLTQHYDLDDSALVAGDPASAGLIFDDDELRDALALADNVYIGTTASLFRINDKRLPLPLGSGRPRAVSKRTGDRHPRVDQAIQFLKFEPTLDAESLAKQFPNVTEAEASRFVLTARVIHQLEKNFSLNEAQIASAGSTESEIDIIQAVLPAAKRIAAARLARQFFDRGDNHDWPAFLQFALPDIPADALTPERATLMRAFRAERTWRVMKPQWPAPENGWGTGRPMPYDFVLPLDKLAAAARGVGLVSFEPDQVDGRLRSIPLLSVARQRLLPHLGFLVAADLIGARGDRIAMSPGRIELDKLRIPIDQRGETLINWHTTSSTARWEDLFVHIPVTRVLEIALNREAIRDNQKRLRLAWAELLKARHAETPAEYNEYIRLVNERSALADAPAELSERITAIEKEALTWLERMANLWQRTEPQNDQERAERDRIIRWQESLAGGQLVERLRESDQRMRLRNQELMAELKPRLAGAICLVGYTASAQADLVATPIDDNIPGVMAHANVINMMLQNRFVRTANAWADLMLCALTGLLVTWNAARCGPLRSLTRSLALALVLFVLGGTVFYSTGLHLATVPTIALLILPWGAVTVYRQLTEERARRSFERALGQYTSPAIAARIAENADAHDLAPQSAQVTCFFCDLQGFTALSERLGPDRTRQVLNPYLQSVSQVLTEHNAIVNKFIGDGVFAFFNAPILPCDDHARAACDAAIKTLSSTRTDGHRSRDDQDLDSVRLSMRVGLATGPVFVGDYGSDTKLDYTCIGDTVNVASRLEHANKLLGTTILVDGTTRNQCTTGGNEQANIRAATESERAMNRAATVRERETNRAATVRERETNRAATVRERETNRAATESEQAMNRAATVRERKINDTTTSTDRAYDNTLLFRPVGLIELAGRVQPVSAYELIGFESQVNEPRRKFIELFSSAVQHYQNREWNLCLSALQECAASDPHDRLVQLYSRAAQHLQKNGTPENWNRALALPSDPTRVS